MDRRACLSRLSGRAVLAGSSRRSPKRPHRPVLLQAHHASRPIGGNGSILITGYQVRPEGQSLRNRTVSRRNAPAHCAWCPHPIGRG
jgi:hypothetical protein